MKLWRRIVLIFGIILLAIVVFFTVFHTETVLVSGNTRYSDDDVKSICLDGALSNNTFLFTLFHKRIELGDMPYLDHVDSEMIDRGTIHLSVKERIACARIRFGGKVVYFDKEGNVLEIRERDAEQDKTAVLLAGAEPDTELIAEGDVIFEDRPELLSELSVLSTLLLQFELVPDSVSVDDENNMVLVFGRIRANLGSDTYLEEKVARIDAILPDLAESAGTLHLEDYAEGARDIIFEAASPEAPPETLQDTASDTTP